MAERTEATFRGACMGVSLRRRGPEDPHVVVVLEIEDDDVWHEKLEVSSHWLDELIEQLRRARDAASSQKADMHNGRQYGWRFREETK